MQTQSFDKTALINLAHDLRKDILKLVVTAHTSHIACAYSTVELLTYLYQQYLHINPKKPFDPNRDRFVLSKGWGISALYCVLAREGFFDTKLLESYCTDGSKMIGCATRNGIPGIEATTGSMGHGLPLGVGMALAARKQKKSYKTVVLMGDGECDEGSTWEAVAIAGHHKLSNLVVIIDHNKWQSFGRITDVLNIVPLKQKWEAFGWSAQEIDGHDFGQIHEALSHALDGDKPHVVIAHTVKGKGVSIFEDRNEWHYKTPSGDDLEIAKKEIQI